jgi:hypothetical protein
VPGGLSVKLVCVLAASAFVCAFRLAAGGADEGAKAATTLSPAGASALASDTRAEPPARGIAAPALSRVAALPALRRAPARPERDAPSRPAPPAPAAPTPTVAPVVTAAPPPAKAKAMPYLGKSFDSKG